MLRAKRCNAFHAEEGSDSGKRAAVSSKQNRVQKETEPSLPYCLGRKGHTEPEMAFRCPAAGSSSPLNTAESEGHGASSRLGPGPGQVLDNLLSSCHGTLS